MLLFWINHFCSAKSNQETPPSVIHGWKATDLLLMMVKRKIYFRSPISRQNFANAFAETPNLNVEVRHIQLLESPIPPPLSVCLSVTKKRPP